MSDSLACGQSPSSGASAVTAGHSLGTNATLRRGASAAGTSEDRRGSVSRRDPAGECRPTRRTVLLLADEPEQQLLLGPRRRASRTMSSRTTSSAGESRLETLPRRSSDVPAALAHGAAWRSFQGNGPPSQRSRRCSATDRTRGCRTPDALFRQRSSTPSDRRAYGSPRRMSVWTTLSLRWQRAGAIPTRSWGSPAGRPTRRFGRPIAGWLSLTIQITTVARPRRRGASRRSRMPTPRLCAAAGDRLRRIA